jgi:hypothetical protein
MSKHIESEKAVGMETEKKLRGRSLKNNKMGSGERE